MALLSLALEPLVVALGHHLPKQTDTSDVIVVLQVQAFVDGSCCCVCRGSHPIFYACTVLELGLDSDLVATQLPVVLYIVLLHGVALMLNGRVIQIVVQVGLNGLRLLVQDDWAQSQRVKFVALLLD